jgi:hypothetical protein
MTEDIQARARRWLDECDADSDGRPETLGRAWLIIRDLLAAVETRQWQPIATAPKDGTTVVYVVARRVSSDAPAVMWGYWNTRLEGWYRFAAKAPTRIYPTHWMPLPSPPEPPR